MSVQELQVDWDDTLLPEVEAQSDKSLGAGGVHLHMIDSNGRTHI